MKKFLQRLLAAKKSVRLFAEEGDSTSFVDGYLVRVCDEYVLLFSVDEDGVFDGYCLKRIENIFRADTDSQYLQALKKTIERQEIIDPFGAADLTLKDVFCHLAKEKILCSVELFDDAETKTYGFIKDVSETAVVMNEIDRYGKDDGSVCIRTENVTTVCFGSKREQKRFELLVRSSEEK